MFRFFLLIRGNAVHHRHWHARQRLGAGQFCVGVNHLNKVEEVAVLALALSASKFNHSASEDLKVHASQILHRYKHTQEKWLRLHFRTLQYCPSPDLLRISGLLTAACLEYNRSAFNKRLPPDDILMGVHMCTREGCLSAQYALFLPIINSKHWEEVLARASWFIMSSSPSREIGSILPVIATTDQLLPAKTPVVSRLRTISMHLLQRVFWPNKDHILVL